MENSITVPQKIMNKPHDPAIPLLAVYLKNLKTFIHKDICTPMFVAALLTVTKAWRQPKHPSVEDCMT